MKQFAIVLLSVLALAACTPDAPETPEPSEAPATQSPTPEPSPSPSPEPSESPSPEPSPSEESPSPDPMESLSPEQEAAAEAVMEYFRIMDATRSDVKGSLQPLADITDGNMRRMAMGIIRQLRELGLQQQSAARYEVISVDPPHTQEGEIRVVVTACSDATQAQMIDIEAGEPVDKSSTIPFITFNFTAADRHGWKIIDGRNRETESCP